MTKFEEEVKRPANGPLTELNNNMQEVFSQYRKMRQYADYLEYESKQKDERIQDFKNALNEASNELSRLSHENGSLKSQLQQQALPVVPEFVAEFIESYKDRRTIYGAFDKISKNRKTYPKLYEWVFEDENSQATFALAIITGKYEVEKPQLFYIDLPKVFGLSDSTSDSTFVSKAESGIISEFTKGKDYALKLTEQEIKSIDERYWQFAVPVGDGE
ncbi:DUF1642 domain-containing protein [Lactococcus lactis]|uniref:DUF1642 domain-containing protein n=1 Tax=Lactococcus lactis TaxID=1358 RepID=UPI003A7FE580